MKKGVIVILLGIVGLGAALALRGSSEPEKPFGYVCLTPFGPITDDGNSRREGDTVYFNNGRAEAAVPFANCVGQRSVE